MGRARWSLFDHPANSPRLLAKITDGALPYLSPSHDLRAVHHSKQSIIKTREHRPITAVPKIGYMGCTRLAGSRSRTKGRCSFAHLKMEPSRDSTCVNPTTRKRVASSAAR